MNKYKVGGQVISIPTSDSTHCAPEGLICTVTEFIPRGLYTRDCAYYEVQTPEGEKFIHFENELKPASEGCDYCQKGKTLTYMNFGETSIKTYLLGNLLYTEAHDHQYDDEDSTAIKIKVCPVCGIDVHKAPDEEMEEEIDE